MTSEEYADIFNGAKFSMIRLFPDGKKPTDDAARNEALSKLRARRAELEKIAMNARIEASGLLSLEAEILAESSEELKKELRKRDKENAVPKMLFNREKRDLALQKMIDLYGEETGTAMYNQMMKGKKQSN